MALQLDEATLLATVLGAILFGLFTFLFITTTYILVFKRKKMHRMHKPIFAVSVLMYTVALTHIVAAVVRTSNGFINFRDNPGPVAYFLDSKTFIYLFKIGFYILQTIIGDSFVVYRLWVVWSGDKRIVLPALVFLTADTVCGIMALVSDASVSPTTPVFNARAKHWIVSFYCLTLFTNSVCTALIAFKIWLSDRKTSAFMKSRDLWPIVVIVIESGAIYSTALIALLIAYVTQSWGHYIVLDMMVQIVGIVFSLIIVRIGLGISAQDKNQKTSISTPSRGFGSQHYTVPMKPMTVLVSESTNVRDDDGNSLDERRDCGTSSRASASDIDRKPDGHLELP